MECVDFWDPTQAKSHGTETETVNKPDLWQQASMKLWGLLSGSSPLPPPGSPHSGKCLCSLIKGSEGIFLADASRSKLVFCQQSQYKIHLEGPWLLSISLSRSWLIHFSLLQPPRALSLAYVCLIKLLLKLCLFTFPHGRPAHISLVIKGFLSCRSGPGYALLSAFQCNCVHGGLTRESTST